MSTSRAQTRKSCRTTVVEAAFISLICSEPKRKTKAERWNDQALLFSPSLDAFSIAAAAGSTMNYAFLVREATFGYCRMNHCCLYDLVLSAKSHLWPPRVCFSRARGWFRLVVPPITIFGLLCGLKGKQFWIEIASLVANFLTLCYPPHLQRFQKNNKKPSTFQFRREFVSTGEDMNLQRYRQQFDSINMIFSRLQGHLNHSLWIYWPSLFFYYTFFATVFFFFCLGINFGMMASVLYCLHFQRAALVADLRWSFLHAGEGSCG